MRLMKVGIVRGMVVNPLRVSSSRSQSALSPTSGHRCARIFRLFCRALDARFLDCLALRAVVVGAKISARASAGGCETGGVGGGVACLAVMSFLQLEAPGPDRPGAPRPGFGGPWLL